MEILNSLKGRGRGKGRVGEERKEGGRREKKRAGMGGGRKQRLDYFQFTSPKTVWL